MSDIAYVGLAGSPCGGTRILAEHLNGLVDRGHNCTLILMQGNPIDWMPTKFAQAGVPGRILDRFDVLVATEINTWPVVADHDLFPNAQRRKVFIQMVEHMFFPHEDEAWKKFQDYYHHLETLEPIVISKWLQRWVKRQCGQVAPVIRNGVNTDMFYPDPIVDRDKLRILIEGHGKNMAKDIENMSHQAAVWLRDKEVDFELWGFSQYPQPYEYDHYWRLPSQSLIRQIYSSCDILLKASRFEGRSCLTGDTLIMTGSGVRPISEIVPHEDEVIGDDGKLHGVSKVISRPLEGELVEITVRTNPAEPIKLTPDHPVLAVRTSKCVAKRGRGICKPSCQRQMSKWTGENTACTAVPYREYSTEWIEAGELCEGDALVIPSLCEIATYDMPMIATGYMKSEGGLVWDYMTNKSAVKVPDKLPVTHGSMWLYGIYLAEGWTSIGKIEFALHSDEVDIASRIASEMMSAFGLKCRVSDMPGELGVKLTFFHSVVARTIDHYFGRGAHGKRVPRELALAYPDLQAWLLKGFVDGDGCINDEAIRASTVSASLVYGLRSIARRCGMVPSVSRRVHSASMIDGREISGADIYTIWIGGIDRLALSNIFDVGFAEVSKSYRTTWTDKHLQFAPISKIRRLAGNGEDVYDLSVPDIEHFATTSGIVHNCVDVEAMACGCAVNRAIIRGKDDLKHNYNCLVTRYSNQDVFQDNLMRLVEDKRLRDRLVTGGLDYVDKHLKWTDIIPALEGALLS